MSKDDKIIIGFASVKFNIKTGKWDTKLFVNGKVKWIRGFSTEIDATICAKSYLNNY